MRLIRDEEQDVSSSYFMDLVTYTYKAIISC